MIRMLIEPRYVMDAVLTGRCLMVEVGDGRRKVTLINRKDYPNLKPASER